MVIVMSKGNIIVCSDVRGKFCLPCLIVQVTVQTITIHEACS